ncbi:receptor-type tyrosine-protein phosphatase U-like [Platysternon megacephalum]|uniref:Receptor-type tyrosine-protein phosphatase U-like n=1 Tax=Platysternon megacephalum TaxID=55544 RepID=A0A4D9F1G9_9SAUR|nr:receptor-type tyrosine-protein phosphatase U-like [Platysternon megacephalum]
MQSPQSTSPCARIHPAAAAESGQAASVRITIQGSVFSMGKSSPTQGRQPVYRTGGRRELLLHLNLFQRLESGISLAESHLAHVKSLSTPQNPIAGKAILDQDWHTEAEL